MQKYSRKGTAAIVLTLLTVGGLTLLNAPATQAQTQGAMNQSAARESEKADAAMNAAYKKLMFSLNNEQKARLKKAQAAWLKFRDAESVFLSSKVSGGSVYSMALAARLTALTRTRTEDLNKAYIFFHTEGVM